MKKEITISTATGVSVFLARLGEKIADIAVGGKDYEAVVTQRGGLIIKLKDGIDLSHTLSSSRAAR